MLGKDLLVAVASPTATVSRKTTEMLSSAVKGDVGWWRVPPIGPWGTLTKKS